jgi:hypothetical protein
MRKNVFKMMKRIFIVLPIFAPVSLIYSQNGPVGIGTSSPNLSAILDLDVSSLPNNGKRGVLLPRVALVNNTDITTIPNPPTALIVYNTTDAGTGSKAVKANKLYRFANGRWDLLITPDDLVDEENGATVKKLQFIGIADQNVLLTNGPFVFRLRNASGNSSALAYDIKLTNAPGTTITVFRSTRLV